MLLGNKNQTTAEGVIQCPTCQEKGIRQNIARIKDGKIIVMRLHKLEGSAPTKEYTIFESSSYKLYCGRCGSLVLSYNE